MRTRRRIFGRGAILPQLFFLSHPRRFGESLTVFTHKAVFEDKKELFKGLAMYDKPHRGKPYLPHPSG